MRMPSAHGEAVALAGGGGGGGSAARRPRRRRSDGAPLSFDDFIIALVAMDPTTAHGGVWNGLRAQYTFRTYDLDEDAPFSYGEEAPEEVAMEDDCY